MYLSANTDANTSKEGVVIHEVRPVKSDNFRNAVIACLDLDFKINNRGSVLRRVGRIRKCFLDVLLGLCAGGMRCSGG